MRFRLIMLSLIITLVSCSRAMQSETEFMLGTICSITLFDHGKPQVYRDIFNRLREIEGRMSTNIVGTDIDRVNKAAGVSAVEVHSDVFDVIEQAYFYAELSGAAFDPTVGPLVSLWGINSESPRVPLPEEIENILPLLNWQNMELDRNSYSVFLKKTGMALDLGAIAKGYAADEVSAIIKKAGIPRAIIDLGGNVVLVGEKKDKSLWKVGIQNPLESRGNYIGIVQTGEKSVVTSGVYERYFEKDGLRYHHIFSPMDGYPVWNELLSVTIIADRSIDADAVSTSAFVLGYEKGSSLVESLGGVDAVFICADKSVYLTGGVDFTLSDTNYRIEVVQPKEARIASPQW